MRLPLYEQMFNWKKFIEPNGVQTLSSDDKVAAKTTTTPTIVTTIAMVLYESS